MKHSISNPNAYRPIRPFDMPEPQREHALRIAVEVAQAADVPPAMLVTHLPHGGDSHVTGTRNQAIRRIMREVGGVSVRMLARAFRRDAALVRAVLKVKAAPGGASSENANCPSVDATE